MSPRKQESVELTFLLLGETELAYSVAESEDDTAFWLPKSQVEVVKQDKYYITLDIPEWLADKHSLI